jgi:hypothetical protein
MTINFGKRNPGGLTAASPGDTLYVPFATYQDSGASIGIGGTLAVSDIEIFKDGIATPRATDSGYSLISDTGQYGDRVGLHRFSVSLFNTADDPTFYAIGSHYHVAVDAITVDGRTVRFFPAVFEIGEPRANVIAFNDTGVNDRLAKIQGDVDTGLRNVIADLDTGLRDTMADFDTGLRDHIVDHATDTGMRDFIGDIDTGIRALFALRDTGAIATAVWAKDARTLTGWSFDTGVQQAIARLDTGLSETIDRILADTDTGLKTGLSVNVDQIDGDTGAADVLGKFAESKLSASGAIDTGTLAGTKAGTIDANVTDVNSVSVGGSGTGGDPWGPA